MPLGKTRDKVLYGLGKARGRAHRYTRWRWAVAALFTLAIAALPAFGLLRFDLWGGAHEYLGRPLSLVETAKAFAFPFLAINLAIIVASRFVGRYLCGFVCPYGAVARLAEWLRFRCKTRVERAAGLLALVAVCSGLAAIAFSFWVDWRVFRDGSALALSLAASFLLGLAASFVGMVRGLGLGFCRNWCPSGVYFALLGVETLNAIEFSHPDACTECKACEKVCPMDLEPRSLAGAEPRAGSGFYPDALSSYALCIRCGDCVNACEATTARNQTPTPLRMGFLARAGGAEAAPAAAQRAPEPPPETEPSGADVALRRVS